MLKEISQLTDKKQEYRTIDKTEHGKFFLRNYRNLYNWKILAKYINHQKRESTTQSSDFYKVNFVSMEMNDSVDHCHRKPT